MISEELLQGFISEASDLLDDIESTLVGYPKAEETAERIETVNRVFRHFHSIKGSAGFVGLHDIARLTHEAETLLELYRRTPDKVIPQDTISLLCRTVDFLRVMFSRYATDKDTNDEDAELADLIEDISKSTKFVRGVSPPNVRHDTTVALTVRERKPDTTRMARRKTVFINRDKAPTRELKRDEKERPAGDTKINIESDKEKAPAKASSSDAASAKNRSDTAAGSTKKRGRQSTDTARFIHPKDQRDLAKADFAGRFVSEANDLLEQVEQTLLALEQHPESSTDGIQEVLRCLHSFKGNSGFMSLRDLERLSHRMESEVEATIGRAIGLDAHTFDVLLQMLDVLRQGVLDYGCGGSGSIPEVEAYIQLLDENSRAMDLAAKRTAAIRRSTTAIAPNPADTADTEIRRADAPAEGAPAEAALPLIGQASAQEELGKAMADAAFKIHLDAPFVPSEPAAHYGDTAPVVVPRPEPENRRGDSSTEPVIPSPSLSPSPAPAGGTGTAAERQAENRQAKRSSTVVKRKPNEQGAVVTPRNDIRVDLNKLDMMLDLLGELVIAETMVTRHPVVVGAENESLERAVHQLRRVANSLQDMAMSVRMIPLASTFRRMIRLVYDLSVKARKQVDLVLLGEETEVDRTVIERISDPMVHIIRNAIDHGIESAEERARLGKPETGRIVIEGRHEGGEVWIVITDDGRGLDRAAILEKAISRGLVQGDGSDLTDNQIYHFIFEPGFSTSTHVTDISGRGFGMDVVKKNIEKLSGRIDIRTRTGEGLAVIMRIPLTLAIIEGMLVRAGDQKYIVPLLSIRESLKPTPEQIMSTPDGQEIVKLRDELIPIVRLSDIFNRIRTAASLEEGILIVVEGDDGGAVAVFADELLGQQETVIKGLSGWLKKARGISGCTILGDGEIGLILDIGSIVNMAKALV